jgi:energy-coupling factor transporter ATP-binding protein EcfA2
LRWHRWDPHLHAPGTVLNDQFKGGDNWERYLAALESASPSIRALGVTDYYVLDSYERVLERKRAGRLASCDLIFPNVELRLGVGTVKGRWVNVHLLVSPEDPDHVAEAKRFLARLEFRAHGDVYACTNEDFIRLGQRVDRTLTQSSAALAKGVEQFKVTFDDLRNAYEESDWARANILIAVAGSETDGTSGVREAADTTLRQEVEKFSHIIFASSVAQREFWLGERDVSPEKLRTNYGGAKPCLHGCDAHDHEAVGAPAENRYSWIKGTPSFDSLRQACIDPAGRTFVGKRPPMNAPPSQVIESIEIDDAEWAETSSLEFNPGLVAIIGARGSGKTALADIIACGCDATSERLHTLYDPLMHRLVAAGGTLNKLTFTVSRAVDVGQWAEAGESLLDLWKISSFRGRGTLRQLAEASLAEVWKSGDPQAVGAAMSRFRDQYDEAFLEGALAPKTDQSSYREWTKNFARWLYSTDHISINYGIHYEGVDITNLSPGTRGIVLLLLYLALDDADDRPLIIDQPEENLDPKSIFDELVGLFVKAKSKRQVIMVTHNANLVVNADADQIIIAEVGPHAPGELPPIRYTSGGLEDRYIRGLVCDILEGGERAFQERARRLRVKLDR